MNMVVKMYYLGLIVGYPIVIDLKLETFKSIEEMDKFTRQFNNSKEVRDKYVEDISEFFLDNMDTIKKNETKNNNQRGRICCYYFDKYGIDFLEVKYRNSYVVRNYHEIYGEEDQTKFIYMRLDKEIERIMANYKYNKGKIYARYIRRALAKFGFAVTDELMYDFTVYFNNRDPKKLKDIKDKIARLIKDNYQFIPNKEEMEVEEDDDRDVLRSDAPEEMVDEYYSAINSGDYDSLYKNHDLDELNRHLNLDLVGKRPKLKGSKK